MAGVAAAKAADTSFMKQLMAHGDDIIIGAHQQTLVKVISIRVNCVGEVSARWTGFQDAAQLVGTLQLGSELIRGQINVGFK